jgi:hypothetical protein
MLIGKPAAGVVQVALLCLPLHQVIHGTKYLESLLIALDMEAQVLLAISRGLPFIMAQVAVAV